MRRDLDDGPRAEPLRFPLLDPLRALAATSVLLVHTSIFPAPSTTRGYGRCLAHLDIGVPFFFLLSAFLLYRPFVEARVPGTRRTRSRTTASGGSSGSCRPTGPS